MIEPKSSSSVSQRRWLIGIGAAVLVTVVAVVVLLTMHGSKPGDLGHATSAAAAESVRQSVSSIVTPAAAESATASGEASAPASDSASSANIAKRPASKAHDVATALSALVTDPASLVAAQAGLDVKAHAADAVPKGSTVTADEKSWEPDGLGGGVMTVTVIAPGKSPATYAVVMVEEGSQWKVLATVPVTK